MNTIQTVRPISESKGSSVSHRFSVISILPQYFVALIALLYASGFLVTLAFHDRFGIRETATELWRAKYIHIGIFALVFPVILNGTIFSWRYISRHPRCDLTLDQMRQRSTPVLFLLVNLEIVCYWLITLTRGSRSTSAAVGLTPTQWILAVIVLGMLLVLLIEKISVAFVISFAKEEKKKQALVYPHRMQVVLRWLLVIVVFALDIWFVLDFRGQLGGISIWIVGFYISMGLVVGGLAAVLASYAKRQKDYGNKTALWTIGACLLPPLFYLMLLAFAYGVFPFIPAARGGGDYTVSPKAVIQFRPSALTGSNSMPFVTSFDKSKTQPLIVIDENSNGIYTADPNEVGGPEEWRKLMGRKPGLVFFTYDVIATMKYESRSSIGKESAP